MIGNRYSSQVELIIDLNLRANSDYLCSPSLIAVMVKVKPRSGAACASRFQKGLLGFSFLLVFLSVTETENMKNLIATSIIEELRL
jgi:hypothetical protein